MNAFTLFRLLSWQPIRKNLLRTFFLIMVVAIGTLLIYASVNNIINTGRARVSGGNIINGRSTIMLNSGDVSIDTALYERIKQTAGIEVTAPLVVDAGLLIENRNLITLWGIDPAIDQSIRDYQVLEGRFVENAGEVLITDSYAEHSGHSIGDTISLIGRRGIRIYNVVGILAREGVAALNGGDLFILSYADVQNFRGDSNFTSLGLVIAPENKDTVLNSLELPEGIVLADPSDLGEATLVTVVVDMLNLTTNALPAFLGGLMMTNTIAASIAQRRKDIAILRALGASRNKVLSLFLVEAAFIGLMGALLGWGFALLIIAGSNTTTQIGNFSSSVSSTLPLWGHLWSIFCGTMICVVATWLPARRAMQIDPTEAMNMPVHAAESKAYGKIRVILGILILLAVLVSRFLFDNSPLAAIPVLTGILGTAIALLLLFPPLMSWMSQHCSPIMSRLFGFSGRLAAENLAKRHRQASATSLIVLLVVWFWALATTISAGQQNFSKALIDRELAWDLIISGAGQDENNPIASIAPEIIEELRSRPDVASLIIERQLPISYGGSDFTIRAIDTAAFSAGGGNFYWEIGDASRLDTLKDSAQPTILASGFNALMLGLRAEGVIVTLQTPNGEVDFRVVGTIADLSAGSFIMDMGVYQQLWGDMAVDRIRIRLVEGTNVAELRRELQNRYVWQGLYVIDTAELSTFATVPAGGDVFAAALLLPFMILSIANMLFIAILDRRRELGMLRAVGATRRQISLSVILEAAIITALAALIALPAVIFSFETMLFERITSVALELSIAGILQVIASSIFVAAFAAYLPARRAGKLEILEALRYE